MKKFLLILLSVGALHAGAQGNYTIDAKTFREAYVESHEVVKGEDRKALHFFPINPRYRVQATFEKVENGAWIEFKTSTPMKQVYRVYGTASFRINDTLVKLNIYQSQMLLGVDQYKDYLFLPFTDLTTGNESYETGRYIDLKMGDINKGSVTIDFNRCYNPYCAYRAGYSCPIPPKENALPVAIPAGEMKYGKH